MGGCGLEAASHKGFKVSNDPLFEEKVTDIVGLYLDPPDRAVVLCVDEKVPDSGSRPDPTGVCRSRRAGPPP